MKRLILSLLVIAFMSTGAMAATTTKIGIIDFQKILTTSESGKAAMAEISKQHKKFTDTLQQKKQEIVDLQEKLKRGALAMSPEQRDKKERDIKIKVLDLQSMEKSFKNELKNLNLKYNKEIQDITVKLAQEIGKKEKFTIIQEKKTGGVVFVADEVEITDRIIKKMNEMKK